MSEVESEQFRSPEEAEAARAFERQPDAEQTIETEKRKPPFDAVIVLGCGIGDPLWKWLQVPEAERDKHRGWMLNLDARLRTAAAVEMYLQGLTSKIIFTGGRTAELRGIPESEAQKMKEYAAYLLQQSGVPEEQVEQAIILEDRATNTIENIANVCNIVDQNPEQFQHLAILTNQYHLDRAQELISKFNLEAQGFSAEDLLQHSAKYQRIVERFFATQAYQDRLAGERRWTKGLREMPQYWHPQTLTVESPERIDYILKSLGLEQIAEKVGRDALIQLLRETPRKIPPEKWGIRHETERSIHRTKIFLARHGESTHNVAEIPYFAGGSLEYDEPLTEQGIETARKLAERLKEEGVEVLVCSDLKRSKQTAEIIAESLGYPGEIVELEGLREVHVGELTGKTREQISQEGSQEAQKALELFLSGDIRQISFPGGG